MFEVSPIVNQPQPQVAFKAKPNVKTFQQIAKTSDAINKMNGKLNFAQRLKIWFANKILDILPPAKLMPKADASMQKPYRSGSIIEDMAEMIANNLMFKPKWTKADSEFMKKYLESKHGPINIISKKK